MVGTYRKRGEGEAAALVGQRHTLQVYD